MNDPCKLQWKINHEDNFVETPCMFDTFFLKPISPLHIEEGINSNPRYSNTWLIDLYAGYSYSRVILAQKHISIFSLFQIVEDLFAIFVS